MNEIKVVDNRIDQKVKPTFEEGIIESVFPTYAKVRLIGNTKSQNAYYDPAVGIEVGKNCIVTWLPNRGQYAIVACFFARGNSASFTARLPESLELAPPSNLQAFNFLPNTLVFQWDAPPQQPVAFEVQTNALPQESGATLRLVTRGSYLIVNSTTTLCARVRSIAESFARSSFTAWATGVPAPASAAGFTLAGETGSTTIVAGDTLTIQGTGIDAIVSGDTVTLTLDYTELASVTPAANDKVAISDTSDSGNPKTILVSDLSSVIGGGGGYSLIPTESESDSYNSSGVRKIDIPNTITFPASIDVYTVPTNRILGIPAGTHHTGTITLSPGSFIRIF